MIVCTHHNRRGALLVEVVVGLALSILFAVAIVNMSLGTFESVGQSRQQLVATNYANEGLESVRTLSRQNFDTLINGTHGVHHDNKKFVLSGAQTTWSHYTMRLTIEPTYRNKNDALVLQPADSGALLAAGGWVDPQAKLVTAHVSWPAACNQTGSVALQTVITKWFKYPLQKESATGSLSGSEYIFTPIDGTPYAQWKALYWNSTGGIDKMQVRVGDTYTELQNSDWIGPDGGTGSFYTVSGTGLHAPSAGSGQWFQGKAWLDGSGTEAPILTILYE